MLDPDRYFNPDPAVRQIAAELYADIKNKPLICPHGHVDPVLFSENKPFPDPAHLLIIPDHYVFRMLYSQGIQLEDLGIKPLDGSPYEQDSRKIWKIFCENFYLFAGTPSGIWITQELEEVFGITEKLNARNGMNIYDEIQEKLKKPEFLPRALFETFNIEVLSTTDGAEDTLKHHTAIRESGWKGKIIPCFRPDGVTNILHPAWQENIQSLSSVTSIDITSYKHFIQALEKQRSFFQSMGAVSTDHGVEEPFTHALSLEEAEMIFQRALSGKITRDDTRLFTAHMMMEMARMSCDDGLVMQIHPGCFRNHNDVLFKKFGPDKGADIPIPVEFTRNLKELLNTYGNNPAFNLVVFTLDETTYSRELAPLAGHYPAMKLGPAWWFHDSIQGMQRHREGILETAGIYNLVGFIDDTRAFPSIPVRHDLARRIDCNYLAHLVTRHIIDREDAHRMSHALAYDLSKQAYHF
jgi:glucuronate isomerase